MSFLKNTLEGHGIFTALRGRSDECSELAFLNRELKGLLLVFDESDQFLTAEYVGEPLDTE